MRLTLVLPIITVCWKLVLALEGAGVEPEFAESLENVTVALGRDAVFSCSVSHLNGHSIGWVKSDTKAIQAIGRKIVTFNTRVTVENAPPGSPTWKLIIKNVQPSDAGFYMAQINTDPMKSQLAYLTVLEPPNIDDSATPSQRQVKEHEPVLIQCQASGNPAPNITWRREDGSAVVNQPNACGNEVDKSAAGTGRLCIPSASRTSMGAYFCIASNGIPPSVSKRIQLAVSFPPSVKAENSIMGTFAGAGQVALECNVEASPQPGLFWHKGNQTVGLMERYLTKTKAVNAYTVKMILIIQNVKEEDAGLYRCQAGDNHQASIRLYGLKSKVNPAPILATTPTSLPPPTVPSSRRKMLLGKTFTTFPTVRTSIATTTLAASRSRSFSNEGILISNSTSLYTRTANSGGSSSAGRQFIILCFGSFLLFTFV